MSLPKIFVLNPNSNETVTEGLRASVAAFQSSAEIECYTLEDGPFGIESDRDIEHVTPLVLEKIQSAQEFDAFVIACYSDPGLQECRATISKPVFGLQESAVRTAVSIGGQFAVLALSDESIRRHLKYVRKLGFDKNLAHEVALNITVDEAANDHKTSAMVVSAGQSLVDELGVSALILGCAGMAGTKQIAETKLPVPVIEPTQAAVELAIKSVS